MRGASLALVAICLAAAAGIGVSPASALTPSALGGFVFVDTPQIAKISCVRLCASERRLQGGSTARITGRALAKVEEAVFHGDAGKADDVETKVRAVGPRGVVTHVPPNAVSGPISLRTAERVASPPTPPVDILPPLPPEVLSSKDHVFPVRGRHDYGGANADFGSGRSGHSHQGHDIFARCGTPLVAARGGRVQFRAYHAAGGHYIVIDGDRTKADYAYMHLVSRSPFKVGDRVRTGQRIGSVGDSGNASGCHLHFELWAAPGWYQGGRPIDPLRALKAWDRAS